MKISKETLSVLKNFSSINTNFAIRKGSTVTTMSPQKNVMASATVAEEFDDDFYIYDLSQFLGVVSLFADPEIEFKPNVAVIKEGKTSIKYYAADKSVLMLPPEKQIKFPGADVTFEITSEMLSTILKTSSVLSAPDLSIIGDGNTLSLKISDLKNSSNNVYEVELGETDQVFTANIQVGNLKMMNQTYSVEVSSKKLSKWTSQSSSMVVYVALEATSTFG